MRNSVKLPRKSQLPNASISRGDKNLNETSTNGAFHVALISIKS